MSKVNQPNPKENGSLLRLSLPFRAILPRGMLEWKRFLMILIQYPVHTNEKIKT